MGTFSIWHWLVVLLVILLLFGSGKISGLMGDLAKGIKSFKQNMKEDEGKDASMAADPAALHRRMSRNEDYQRPLHFAVRKDRPQMVALLSLASGTSVITENLYDARYRYVGELARMGADISVEAQHAIIRGVERLSGCPVLSPDIRAGAAQVLAGLAADGVTEVGNVSHIDRGYEDFVGRLHSLGAAIERI